MEAVDYYKERDNLIEEYQDFVDYVARKLIKALNLPVKLYDDFIAAGYLGLVEAAERYNKSAGYDFKRYAYLRIRGAIIDDIRNHSSLSPSAYQYTKALKAVQDLREGDLVLDRQMSSSKKLSQILNYAAKGALAFRLSMNDVEEEVVKVTTSQFNPEKALINKGQAKQLLQAIDNLTTRERFVIEEYYFKGKSFAQISKENAKLSKSWVSRLHARALKRLKDYLLNAERTN